MWGFNSSSEMKGINFDDVTDLAKFYHGYYITFRNGSLIYKRTERLRVTYSGFRSYFFMKCFGLRTTFTNVYSSSFLFKSNMYPNGIRPSSNLFIGVIIHLPNQLTLAENSFKYTWPMRDKKKEYSMDFLLQQVEILKRRNKANDPCISDDLDFDQMLLDEHLHKIGCKADYHVVNESW